MSDRSAWLRRAPIALLATVVVVAAVTFAWATRGDPASVPTVLTLTPTPTPSLDLVPPLPSVATPSIEPPSPDPAATVDGTPAEDDPASLEAVHAELRRQGWAPADDIGFEGGTLRAVLAANPESASGRPHTVFFAVEGIGVIGTDTPEPSTSLGIVWSANDTIGILYHLYSPDDALCCPSAAAIVRFHWDGEDLVALDEIPTNDRTAPHHR